MYKAIQFKHTETLLTILISRCTTFVVNNVRISRGMFLIIPPVTSEITIRFTIEILDRSALTRP
jgi:hypothetical protein